MITFDEPLSMNQYVAVDDCFFCDPSVQNGQLVLSSFALDNAIPDCESVEDILISSNSNFLAPVTEVSVCVELTNVEDPNIEFDVRLEDGLGTDEENLYRRALIVSQDQGISADDYFINNTNDLLVSEAKQLEPDVAVVRLYAYTSGQSIFLDNIALRSGVVSTQELPVGSLTYNNPVSNQMRLESEYNGRLSVIDATGNFIGTQSINQGENMISFNDFPQGVYFIQFINDENFTYTGKVIKM